MNDLHLSNLIHKLQILKRRHGDLTVRNVEYTSNMSARYHPIREIKTVKMSNGEKVVIAV